MPKRNAIISAASLSVCCPYCGEPQPAPDNGSDMWFSSQVKAAAGTDRVCVSCDESFRVISQNRVSVGV